MCSGPWWHLFLTLSAKCKVFLWPTPLPYFCSASLWLPPPPFEVPPSTPLMQHFSAFLSSLTWKELIVVLLTSTLRALVWVSGDPGSAPKLRTLDKRFNFSALHLFGYRNNGSALSVFQTFFNCGCHTLHCDSTYIHTYITHKTCVCMRTLTHKSMTYIHTFTISDVL